MLRALILINSLLFSCLGFAKAAPLYQVDMIVFTHLQRSQVSLENSPSSLIASKIENAIPLENQTSNAMTPYHALPSSLSALRNEYWALNRKPQYQILFRYTWLQPSNNQKSVALSQINNGGWNVEGTLKVIQSNYYLLDTELLFSIPNNPESAFVFAQKQRLKPGVVYYLDHPKAGMLIKVHQIT